MYNKRSMKAEEFICHDEVEATLKYADENKDNIPLIRGLLEKAKLRKGLDHREASVLLACEDEGLVTRCMRWPSALKGLLWEPHCNVRAALSVKLLRERLRLLSLSSKEQAHSKEKAHSKEVENEVTALQDMGHKRLAIEAGEDPVNNPIEYILECIDTIYGIKHKNGAIRRVNVNIAATTVENYKSCMTPV